MQRMIFANLRRRPLRSAIGVIAVAIEVALILLLVGLTNGMVQDAHNRLQGLGADIVVRSAASSNFLDMSGNTLPVQLAPLIARQPGVAAATAMAMQVGKGLTAVGGVNLTSFDAVSGGFHFLAGGPNLGRRTVIVDDLFADSNHLRVGDRVQLLGHSFRVAGIFLHGKGSRIFMARGVLDQLIGAPAKAAVVYAKLRPGAEVTPVVAQLRRLLPGYNVEPMQQYLTLFTASKIPFLGLFRAVVISVGATIGFLVIFLSMYTTILERTREIGILKSLGASRFYIVRAILQETGALAVVGIGLGIAAAAITRASLVAANPTLPILLQAAWVGWAALIAIVGALVGALYPAAHAAAEDPIAALAYE
ncbi:MAG: ABC transporter permease [Terriglobales bacterium]